MDIYLVNSGKCDFYTPAQPFETLCTTTTEMGRLPMSPKKPA